MFFLAKSQILDTNLGEYRNELSPLPVNREADPVFFPDISGRVLEVLVKEVGYRPKNDEFQPHFVIEYLGLNWTGEHD